jgi:hypothetical protein
MRHYSKFGLGPLGHCGKFGNVLWVTAANLMMRYGPVQQIWLCTMGHCSGCGYALEASARNEALL